MLVILNNRIANGRVREDSMDNLDAPPRSPRHLGGCVFTVPSERQTSRVGGSAIVVTKDRLVFRLDPNRAPPLPSMSECDTRDTRSTKSVQSGNLIYVSPVLEFSFVYGIDCLLTCTGTRFRIRTRSHAR
jgi:hypothetical protein